MLRLLPGANLPPIIAWKVSNTLGSFSFSGSNLSLLLLFFWFDSFSETKVKGHHQQVVVAPNVCSWKTSCSGDVHSWSEALPHLNVINLVVVLSIWAMPCPSSGCLVTTKFVRQHKIVKGGKLRKSESSLICVIIAEGSENALPVFISILAHFCIPVSLPNKNVFLRCLINEGLKIF